MTGAAIVGAIVIGGLLIFMLVLTLKNFHPELTMEEVFNDNHKSNNNDNTDRKELLNISKLFIAQFMDVNNKNDINSIYEDFKIKYKDNEKALNLLSRIKYFLTFSKTIEKGTLEMLVNMGVDKNDK